MVLWDRELEPSAAWLSILTGSVFPGFGFWNLHVFINVRVGRGKGAEAPPAQREAAPAWSSGDALSLTSAQVLQGLSSRLSQTTTPAVLLVYDVDRAGFPPVGPFLLADRLDRLFPFLSIALGLQPDVAL